MTATRRVRFSDTAQLSKADQKKLASTLNFDRLCDLRRLAGFCLVNEGSRALCLNEEPLVRKAFAELKPSLHWSQNAKADIMVGDGILQKLFTSNQGGWEAVRAYLREQIENLPMGGRLVLRENAMLVPEEMVLLELPDYRTKLGKNDPSQIALKRLIHFSQHARPWLAEDHRGFWMDEVPAMRPDTRLFSLPIKWASEFLLRKDMNDVQFEESMNTELVIGNERMMRTQVFNPLGLRVVLHAPHWDKEAYDTVRTFALYKESDRTLMPPPPTEMVIVAEKIAHIGGQSRGLWLGEQRAHREEPHQLSLITVQNDKTGDTQSLVTGLEPDIQIMPWRYLDDERIGVYLKKEIPTPLSNAKPRAASPIDGRRFSGYLPGPTHLPADEWDTYQHKGVKAIGSWLKETSGLSIAPLSDIFEGKMSYPAPDFIDQAMRTIFIQVKMPVDVPADYVCYDANDLLHAIHSGLMPFAAMEAQLWQLAELAKVHLTLMVDKKVELPLDRNAHERVKEGDFDILCKQLVDNSESVSSYTALRGNTSDWRVARSVFVEETSGGPRSAINKEFVLSDEEPLHKAALMCMSRNMDGEVMAGFSLEDCPVPARHGQGGKMARVPTVPLPNNLRSIPETREYLAKLLEVDVENVVPCGQAVFTHVDVTQQKIFPFMVTSSPWFKHMSLTYFTLDKIQYITKLDATDSFLWVWGLAMAQLCDGSEASLVNNWDSKASIREQNTRAPDMQLRVIAKNYG